MTVTFDARVVPTRRIDLVRAIQQRAECRLAGGAALAGLHLKHRMSRDVDLFFSSETTLRDLIRVLPDIATETGIQLRITRDARTHVRVDAMADAPFEVDFVYEPLAPLEPPERTTEDILVDSWVDLRASKIACLVERSEPRDLVDILFLERAGFPPESDLIFAIKKDGGVDPAALAWLLRDFPTEPLPLMLSPLTVEDLRVYRDLLAERFRALATPSTK